MVIWSCLAFHLAQQLLQRAGSDMIGMPDFAESWEPLLPVVWENWFRGLALKIQSVRSGNADHRMGNSLGFRRHLRRTHRSHHPG